MDLRELLLDELETLYQMISDDEKEGNEEIDEYFERIKELMNCLPE